MPAKYLLQNLLAMKTVVRQHLHGTAQALADIYLSDAGQLLEQLAAAGSANDADEPAPEGLAQEYLELLLAGKRQGAFEYVQQLLRKGLTLQEVYMQVFQASQYCIGRLWQENKITVAQEHYCTAATQSIMGSLLPALFGNTRRGLKMQACCTRGELHEPGLRMVTDFFELDGFDTYFLGANTPEDTAVEMAADLRVDIIALSTTMAPNVSQVRKAIERFRQTDMVAGVPILVGGFPFKASPGLWLQVGANGFENDAQEALYAACSLLHLPTHATPVAHATTTC